ncbi:MAG TPA: PTS mannose transporter subunit IIAB [Candidatus Eisenbacteria bacterium]|nr:PTS mannose transporter subunit IIAB [Candidatus Eisenbacteria bacterium]
MPALRPAALLVTHGALGRELLGTVERILGAQDQAVVVSNEGRSADGLTEALGEAIASFAPGQSVVIFSDLAAGSCGLAARRASADGRAVRRITGVNLPMLLEFFHYRDTVPLDDLLPRMEAKGRAGIVAS